MVEDQAPVLGDVSIVIRAFVRPMRDLEDQLLARIIARLDTVRS